MITLVTGGIRSGKSAVAEALVSTAPGPAGGQVTYVATGPLADAGADPEWAARVQAHRARRPEHWRTLETRDLPAALSALDGPALVDCLGTWLTAHLDALDAWERDRSAWEPALRERIDALTAALAACPNDVVLVTNEVGLSLVSEHRSGRIFADWLGWANQAVADVADRVDLVVSGHVLTVKAAEPDLPPPASIR